MKGEVLERLQRDRAARQPAVLATWIASGAQLLMHDPTESLAGAELAEFAELDETTRSTLAEAAAMALRSDRASKLELDGSLVFVQPFNPSLRLAIVGAVHIAQHLSAMAQRSGYEVTVIDPRTGFASEARFPGIALSHDWPDSALDQFRLDTRSAVVTLTHDPKLDEPALERAIASSAFYVGALGSRRTHAKRLARLQERGVRADQLALIRAPVGLDIGARSPAEIAISVLAQMTESLRKPSGVP